MGAFPKVDRLAALANRNRHQFSGFIGEMIRKNAGRKTQKAHGERPVGGVSSMQRFEGI
jgi:hypothetical protein